MNSSEPKVADGVEPSQAFQTVLATVDRLVGPEGCAWHGIQTHESLTPYLIEESAELVDAIERQLPAAEMVTELADVLYQVLFHAAIAERDGEGYGARDVAEHLNQKLISRHPHVFGDRGYMSVEELNAEWEQLKSDAAGQRRGSRGVLEGIPAGMPTLAKAAKVVRRMHTAGVWVEPVPSDEADIGAQLLALVSQANRSGIDPDRALRQALEAHVTANLDDSSAASVKE